MIARALIGPITRPFRRVGPAGAPAEASASAAPRARFDAAEARLHRSAAALERASLDAVDDAARAPAAVRADRIAEAVATLIRRHHETRHAP